MIFRRSKKIKHFNIDPDQILLDSENRPGFNTQQFEGMIEKPISKKSIRWFGFFLVLFFLIFTFLFALKYLTDYVIFKLKLYYLYVNGS